MTITPSFHAYFEWPVIGNKLVPKDFFYFSHKNGQILYIVEFIATKSKSTLVRLPFSHGHGHLNKGRFQKKKLMEFSIKLAGWVLDAPVFH